MSCNHEYTNQEGRALEKQVIQLEQKLAAANAMAEELEKDNARQKRLATISRLCKNVQSYRAEKAEEKIKQMQDAIQFDFERFMEFQHRAEQAEAQCTAMRNCDNCNKWCMKQPNNSEFDTLNRMDDCKFNNLSHWELSKKLAKAALEVPDAKV